MCRKSVSVREGSFFSQSKLSLQQWLLVIHWWCRQYPVSDAAEEANITKRTAIQCYQYLRDICSWRLINRDAPILLGGPGHIVQIDESLFRHKPKVYIMFLFYTIKYHPISLGSQRKIPKVRDLGFWNGRYVPFSCPGVHADSCTKRCSNAASHNSTTCASGNNHP